MLMIMAVCLFLVAYVWVLYPCAVIVLSSTVLRREIRPPAEWPGVSVIIAARNEEAKIAGRIENLLSSEYAGPIEVLVGCDGCTDNTAAIVSGLGKANVKAVVFDVNRGRAMVHNDIVPLCAHDIVVFTDAETRFEPDCLGNLVKPFSDPEVGCSVGLIRYVNAGNSGVSESAGLYWRMEEAIRVAESRLGILGFGTGACTAMRKTLFRKMVSWEDLDYAATLMLAIGGARIVYVPEAVATDFISELASAAFQTRVRQTSRSFMSIIRRTLPAFRNNTFWIGVASLSHKTGRHLSPFFLLMLFFSSLAALPHPLAIFLCLLEFLFLTCILVGYLENKKEKRFRPGSIAMSFFVLNLARGVGVFHAITNRRVSSYSTRI